VVGLPRGDGWGDTRMMGLGQRTSLHLKVCSGIDRIFPPDFG
jgi:hypothetical protein